MSQEPGQVIAQKYQLVRRLARGGMGAVWCARHLELEMDVALKFVRSEQGIDASKEERFRREARAAAQIKSQHVVHIHDYGIDAGVPYLAMELLAGEDLEMFLQRSGPLALADAVHLLQQASKGVRAAHQSGVIHRDIKPSNLFVAELAGEHLVKVLDFGIAKGLSSGGSATTTQGQVFGSPAYMSPEQARGGPMDERSDVWSLGAVFYRMVTGVTPFDGANASDIVVKLCTGDAPRPSLLCPGLGEEADAFCRRALARDVDKRFQNVAQFAEACASLVVNKGRSPRSSLGDQPPGRADETAPLERHTDSARGSRSSEDYPAASLRPSISPERPVYSGRRGVWAVAGMLVTLGAFGIWLGRPAAQTRPAQLTQVSGPMGEPAPDAEVSRSGVQPSTLQTAIGEQPTAPGMAAQDSAAEGNLDSTKDENKTPIRARSNAAPSGKAKTPVRPASPATQSSVEKPAIDPVFGLPVDPP